ncbi:MAG: Flp family type IVb pilin [Hyphomicrobiaceae bacterium]
MNKLFARFGKDESGATAIEYALIAAIVGIGIITALGSMKDELNETFEKVESSLSEANAE